MAVAGPLYEISGDEFDTIRQMVRDLSGVNLTAPKRALVVSRLSRRLRELRLSNFTQYIHLLRHNPHEPGVMLNCITTNVTKFFREAHHFDFLRNSCLPGREAVVKQKGGPKKIRIWSAGCATGEEPYTLAMVLHSYFKDKNGWSIKILASDINTEALEKGRSGIYTYKEAEGIPYTLLKEYFKLGTGTQRGLLQAKDCLRALIDFQRVNLVAEHDYSFSEPLDLIFCRNVFIYFDRETRDRVLQRFHRCLVPGGFLCIGHSESINSASAQDSRWRQFRHTIYERLA